LSSECVAEAVAASRDQSSKIRVGKQQPKLVGHRGLPQPATV
jgi:hypothetical protein